MGRWGDGEMGRWGDGEMGRWGDGREKHWRSLIVFDRQLPTTYYLREKHWRLAIAFNYTPKLEEINCQKFLATQLILR
ncbi:hypothetical protein [Floridanema evergladense]|uniref:Uncharacterized protein n=1 Tax=Floridaenema evergladense BLCC-F167 TaxID=3153639 RepID=A0ABV4WTB7_9CYAN